MFGAACVNNRCLFTCEEQAGICGQVRVQLRLHRRHGSASAPQNGFEWIISLVISAPSTPSSIAVAPTLALKAVCSSPGCGFPGPCCPPFLPCLSPPSSPFLCRPLNCSFHNFLHPAGALRNEKREDVDKNKHRECKIYPGLPPDSFSSLLVSAALHCVETAPPLAAAAHCQSRHFPPLKCPFCMSYWGKWSTLLSVHRV